MDKPGSSAIDHSIDEVHVDTEEGADDLVKQIIDADLSDESDGEESGDDPDVGSVCPTWSNICSNGMRQIEFMQVVILLVPIPCKGTPSEFFHLLVDNMFVETICIHTNKYAVDVVYPKSSLTPKSTTNH